MPSLKQTLPSGDINFYRVIASFWGFELSYPDPDNAMAELIESMCDIEYLNGILEDLPEDARVALYELYQADGVAPYAKFKRDHGEIREVGAGKRDREHLYDSPISATEILYYRGLIGKGFIRSDGDPVEQIFLPEEIAQGLELLGFEKPEHDEIVDPPAEIIPEEDIIEDTSFPGRSATNVECANVFPREIDLLGELTTVICALRNQHPFPKGLLEEGEALSLLRATNILVDGKLNTEAVKNFLRMDREQALGTLAQSWLETQKFDELRNLKHIEFEGYWANPIVEARAFILEQIAAIPIGKWWNLSSFIRYIRETYPDFQRPAGNYDTWLMKRASDGEYLKGFRFWDEVEGKQIEYQITRPMRWLRMVDLAGAKGADQILAFRVLPPDTTLVKEDGKLSVSSNGQIVAPSNLPRVIRYHVSRFCEPPKVTRENFIFKVTHASLSKANDQGLTIDHLLTLLRKNSDQPIPPLFEKTLRRWQQYGIEARFEKLSVLKVNNPKVVVELKKTSAARFLREELNPTTIVIPSDAMEKIRLALMEIGIMLEDDTITE